MGAGFQVVPQTLPGLRHRLDRGNPPIHQNTMVATNQHNNEHRQHPERQGKRRTPTQKRTTPRTPNKFTLTDQELKTTSAQQHTHPPPLHLSTTISETQTPQMSTRLS